jgi:hypothetical protein
MRSNAGVPDVRGVWLHPSNYHFSIIKSNSAIPATPASCPRRQPMPAKNNLTYHVVDEDIDIYSGRYLGIVPPARNRKISISSGAAGADRSTPIPRERRLQLARDHRRYRPEGGAKVSAGQRRERRVETNSIKIRRPDQGFCASMQCFSDRS